MHPHSPSLRDEDVRSDPVPLSRRRILAALVAAGVPIGLLFLPYGLVSHGNSEGAAMASAMLMLSWSGSPHLTLTKFFSEGINCPPQGPLIVLANLALLFSPFLQVVLLRQDDG